LYGQVFIDEIRLTKAFSGNNRNQLGYQFGLKKAGLLGNPRFISGIEYTRNRPFIYANLNPAQNFTHHGQILGDWMGNNADRVLLFSKYTPVKKLYTSLSVEYIRKGSAGSADDQYLANPQPPFMFGQLFKQKLVTFEMNYYLLQNINIRILANWLTRDSQINQSTLHLTSESLGVWIGL
jgi:predicted porin